MSELVFPDEAGLADLKAYAGRLRRMRSDGAMRLQCSGTTLAAYAGVFDGRGITGSGTVLGLRVLRLAESANLDATVAVAALLDRLARETEDFDILSSWGVSGQLPADRRFAVSIPPMTVTVTWAGVSPPRSGWVVEGEVAAAPLIAAAVDGIARIAATAEGPQREKEVARAWSERVDGQGEVTGGMAFAAYGLGFLAPHGGGRLLRSGPWLRLTTPGGHVLAR